MGLNPDVWFDNVELATARAVSREPVIYVRNIDKYGAAYRRIADHLIARQDQLPNQNPFRGLARKVSIGRRPITWKTALVSARRRAQ